MDFLNFSEPRITGFFLDQTNESCIDDVIANGPLKDIEFDIICDDGLHYFPVNCNVMKKLLPKVKKGGVYIIEDILHSQYDYRSIDFNLLNGKEYQYIRFPNSHNTADNNLFIVKV